MKRDDSWSLAGVRVASEGGAFTVTGRGRGPAGTLDLALDLPKLGVLRPEVEGALTAMPGIGFGRETELKLKAEVRDLKRGPLASQRLSLAATTTLEATGAARGTVEATGDLAGQALSLNGRFARDAAAASWCPPSRETGRVRCWTSPTLPLPGRAPPVTRDCG